LPIETSEKFGLPRDRRRVRRLLDEVHHPAFGVHRDAAEGAGLGAGHRDGRHREVAALAAVQLEHQLDVHLVDVVGAEDGDVAGLLVAHKSMFCQIASAVRETSWDRDSSPPGPARCTRRAAWRRPTMSA
jgi:hypothetical protein